MQPGVSFGHACIPSFFLVNQVLVYMGNLLEEIVNVQSSHSRNSSSSLHSNSRVGVLSLRKLKVNSKENLEFA